MVWMLPYSGPRSIAVGRTWKKCNINSTDSKAGEKIPRPVGVTVHRKGSGHVLDSQCQQVSESGPLGEIHLDEPDGYRCLLVMVDGMSDFVWVEEPTGAE